MKVICPVTKKECPYLKKLETDVCPREHECDQVRDSLAKITKRPPSTRKRLLIAALIIVLALAALVFFLAFDNLLFKGKDAPSTDPSDFSGIVVETTRNPSFEPLPTPSPLPEIPVTGEQALAPARLVIGDEEWEILPVPLDENGMIEVAHYPDILSWYHGSAIPGQSGSCIIFGYKYYSGIAGAFRSLDSLKPGDSLTFTLDNGANVIQTVYNVRVYRDGALDDDALSVSGEDSRTVLISETGSIDPTTGQYEDLVAVFLN